MQSLPAWVKLERGSLFYTAPPSMACPINIWHWKGARLSQIFLLQYSKLGWKKPGIFMRSLPAWVKLVRSSFYTVPPSIDGPINIGYWKGARLFQIFLSQHSNLGWKKARHFYTVPLSMGQIRQFCQNILRISLQHTARPSFAKRYWEFSCIMQQGPISPKDSENLLAAYSKAQFCQKILRILLEHAARPNFAKRFWEL